MTQYDAIIIGTGFSGLCLAIKLKEKGIHNFIILEKSNAVGGTWRENTYPGAECDIPSALYSYSFEPYPYWEYKWSHQDQILEYLNHCVSKYDLHPHIHFEKEFIGAAWNTSKKIWECKSKQGDNYESKILVTAIGQLHHPSIPDTYNLEAFKGSYFHSAKWNHDIDLENKRVAVVGNAASAIQFIPEIAKVVKELTVFQRSANWMLPKQDRLYKNWEKKLVRRLPILLKMYRLKIWLLGGALYLLMQNKNHTLRKIFQAKTKRYIRRHISDSKLIDKLTPTYPMGAKRVLFSDNYYEALAKENVTLEDAPIVKIGDDEIQVNNEKKYKSDVIIFGTGFITNPFLKGMQLIGKNNITIQAAWKQGPKSYLGMCVHGFPNFFMMYGPNTNLGHNSIIIMAEAQANYISQSIQGVTRGVYNSMEIKKEILETHYSKIQSRLGNMIWNQIDNSWYKTAHGISNNWPGRTMEYMRLTKKVDFNEFETE